MTLKIVHFKQGSDFDIDVYKPIVRVSQLALVSQEHMKWDKS